jgi:uncharacterized protein YdhG (YjbR/CyaY superfamily)
VEEYINQFEGDTKNRLEQVHILLKNLLPEAQEKISYGVPTFYNENGYIVYFAGYKDFVSIYPVHLAPTVAQLVQPYLSGKSTARFYHKNPLPKDTIEQIVRGLQDANEGRRKK